MCDRASGLQYGKSIRLLFSLNIFFATNTKYKEMFSLNILPKCLQELVRAYIDIINNTIKIEDKIQKVNIIGIWIDRVCNWDI